MWVALRAASIIAGILLVAFGAGVSPATIDTGVIRLPSKPPPSENPTQPADAAGSQEVRIGEPRSGFDYGAFQARLESLWFQRKTLLSSGRSDDAREQLERIRSSCAEEGIKRLDHVAGALVSEARRDVREGSYDRALASLGVAAALDPDRPQLHLLRAKVHWKADRAYLAAAGELVAALRATLVRSIQDLTLFHQFAFLLGISLVGGAFVFALVMIFRYQLPIRHEIEEWSRHSMAAPVGRAVAWGVLLLPLLTWFGAGWLALYWIVIAFRFMSRHEKTVAAALLLAGAMTLPAYRVGVALFGTAADPAVRTTLLSVGGEYDPNRIVRLRQLVDTHPEDPVYRFLLAGLYKNGRYFEEAFGEYRRTLQIDPALYPVYINVGNIFYATGQFAEAIVNYRNALDLDPQSFLAHYNLHLAQSEAFRFTDAEESLRAARDIDSERVARLLATDGDRPSVHDDALKLASIWEAALVGRGPLPGGSGREWTSGLKSLPLVDPIGVASIVALAACGILRFRSRKREPARRCIRCGQGFCTRCKGAKNEGREYCTQCLHLFVLGDGLAPAAKSRKMYQVERHERRTRRSRNLSSLIFPGVGHLLRGRTVWGLALVVAWVAALVAIQPAWFVTAAGVINLELQPELLLGAGSVPVSLDTTPLALLAIPVLPVIWIMGNAWRWRRREV